ncbi:hypothetical protein OAE12_00735 [bacterium]|nr:hypothetical protein [bacterium]
MKLFLRFISYLFHPLLIPIIGTLFYFGITPKYSTNAIESANILPILILTVVIPIISYLILNNIGLIKSVFEPNLKERRYPLYINIILFILILYKVIPKNYTVELYFFFVGLIGASVASLVLIFLNFKSSLHVTGISSLFMYSVCLSVHFELNITIALSVLMLAIGLVATARLYLKAHNKAELIVGLAVGFLSQLLTIKFWL